MYPKCTRFFKWPEIDLVVWNCIFFAVNPIRCFQIIPQNSLLAFLKLPSYSTIHLKKQWKFFMYPKCTNFEQRAMCLQWKDGLRGVSQLLSNDVRCVWVIYRDAKRFFTLVVKIVGYLHVSTSSQIPTVACKIRHGVSKAVITNKQN